MSNWSPYVDNGGSALGIAGPDFAVIASDTRCSSGYSIISRQRTKTCELTKNVCLVSCGQACEIDALHYKMKTVARDYLIKHKRDISIDSLSRRLSIELYSRRFFPYYTFNILAGVNRDGKGVVYSYDAVGSTEPKRYGTNGSANAMILPVLDMTLKNGVNLPVEKVVELGVDALTAAAERDIHTGDFAETFVITKNGVMKQVHQMKLD